MIKQKPTNCQEAKAFLEQCNNYKTRASHAIDVGVSTRSIDAWREHSENLLKISRIKDKYVKNKDDVLEQRIYKPEFNTAKDTEKWGYKPPVKILVVDIEKYMAEVRLKRLT